MNRREMLKTVGAVGLLGMTKPGKVHGQVPSGPDPVVIWTGNDVAGNPARLVYFYQESIPFPGGPGSPNPGNPILTPMVGLEVQSQSDLMGQPYWYRIMLDELPISFWDEFRGMVGM